MYFFGLVGLSLLAYVLQTASLTDLQVIALGVGGLFVNIAGHLHGHRLASNES